MKKILLSVILLCLFFACRKKDGFVADSFCQDGYIRWGGNPSADGLGWYYAQHLNRSQIYILKDLPVAFQRDSLAVSICMEKTNDLFYCMCASPYHYYKVNTIRLR